MHSIDDRAPLCSREILARGTIYAGIIAPRKPRATGVASALPDLFDLLALMDMDRMKLSDALDRRIELSYAQGRYLLEGIFMPV